MDIDVLNFVGDKIPIDNEKQSPQQMFLTSIAMLALAHGY
jgi:hypothetical protein